MTIRELIHVALCEDIGTGDITTRLTIPAKLKTSARLVAREEGVLAGIGICQQVFRKVDKRIVFSNMVRDAHCFAAGDTIASIHGPARGILTAERTALNFLQRLSGIAGLTRKYVETIADTGAILLDTRKTTPGWRELEKYAVRCGGGSNHRHGLYDMLLVKDNHIAAAGSITAALERCRGSRLPVEVEVTTIAELKEALRAGADRVMLDNMPVARMRRAVGITAGKTELEASGGMNLRRIRRVAETGVNYISVGAITQSAPAADIALDFD